VSPEAAFITIIISISVLVVVALLVVRSRSLSPGQGQEISTRHDQANDNQTPILRGIAGPYQGQEIPLHFSSHQAGFSLGRAPDSALRIEGQLVSRYHALIEWQDGEYWLYDRESTNGTYVNGRRIAQYALKPGDQIRIGAAEFIFQLPGSRSPTPYPRGHVHDSESPPKLTRQQTFQDYVLQETLGQGGMATVYKAASRHDRTTVAIKVLQQPDSFMRSKFELEGKTEQALRHPHIVRVFSYGHLDQVFYIIMEYLSGGTLRNKLIGHPFPVEIALSIVVQTCEALQYAHDRGVIHRDVKPENIMFEKAGNVKLVDFGIAKVASAVTRTSLGTILGTPYYMSVEQARADPVVPASDIYSMGVVLYEMLTGRVPFTGEALDVISEHLREPPIPPRKINPDIPPPVEQVILRSLEKEKERRFQSAREMARALEQAVKQRHTASASSGQWTTPSGTQSAVHSVGHKTAPRPRLVTTSGGRSGQVIQLLAAETPLGRMEIDPQDRYISSRHARVVRHKNWFWLQDVGSQNGTYHNGSRIFEAVPLYAGDQIQIGNTTLQFELS